MIGYENAEIELTWQPNPSQSMVSTVPERVENVTKKVEAWVKAHPNVKVIPVGTSQNINDSMTRLRVSTVEGNAPDLCAVDSFMMPLFIEYARDISDVAKERGLDYNDYWPYIKSQVMVGNELRALWFGTDVRGLFYRKDVVTGPLTTVDDVIAAAKAAKAKGMKDGLIYVGGRGEGSVNNLWGLFWCQGGKLTDEKGNMAIDKEPNKTALINMYKFVKRTIDEGVTPTTAINYGRDANMYGDAAAGNVAMFIANSSTISNMRSLMGKDFDRLWGMAPCPVMKAGQTSTCSSGGWTNMVFSRDEMHRRLAADLAISLYSSDEAAESWLLVEGSLPTMEHQFNSFEYVRNDPFSAAMAVYLQTASTRPAVEIYNTISTEAQVALGNVITGAATPEAAVEQIIKNVKNSQ